MSLNNYVKKWQRLIIKYDHESKIIFEKIASQLSQNLTPAEIKEIINKNGKFLWFNSAH